MSRKIKINLTERGINNAIKVLQEEKNILVRKAQLFCERLADVGIRTARESTGVIDDLGNVTNFIRFYKEVEPSKYGCKAVMYAEDTVTLVSVWKTKEGHKSAEVSALLMAEFGSGQKASAGQAHTDLVNPKVKVGQGEFPNQTHADDPKGWYWKGMDDVWHHSKGIKPTMPMFKAWLDMYYSIDKVAREVFR